jgi:hypothetical protein
LPKVRFASQKRKNHCLERNGAKAVGARRGRDPGMRNQKGADRDQRRDRSGDVSQHGSANLQPTITPSSSWQLSTSGYVRRVNHMYILSGHRQ